MAKKSKGSKSTNSSEAIIVSSPVPEHPSSDNIEEKTAVELPSVPADAFIIKSIPVTSEMESKKRKKNKKESTKKKSKVLENMDDISEPESDESDSDDSDDSEDEELGGGDDGDAKTGVTKVHWTPEELKERNSRTIFVGNVPVACIKKDGFKALKTLFKPCGEIESIRFRSIAFDKLMNRKTAFKAGLFRKSRASLNVYFVYKNIASVAEAIKLNGTVLLEHHIRVDSAASNGSNSNCDKRRSVFVGNLDFEANEEDLWKHFGACGKITNVRLIRDKETNMGKGFGYVEFNDRSAVTLALDLHDSKLGERQIRVSKCQEPGSKPSNSKSQAANFKNGDKFKKGNDRSGNNVGPGRNNAAPGRNNNAGPGRTPGNFDKKPEFKKKERWPTGRNGVDGKREGRPSPAPSSAPAPAAVNDQSKRFNPRNGDRKPLFKKPFKKED